jgi:Trk K+ transport system NAD-binding subunit
VIGTEEQLNLLMKITSQRRRTEGHFIIAGFGDVGNQVAETLQSKNISYKIIDKNKIPGVSHVSGSSTDEATLMEAKIMDASTLIVTLNKDSESIYTTLIARKINPHLKIISRANYERSIDKLYQAGTDYVLSLSVVGGQMLAKIIFGEEDITLAEGFKVFTCSVSRLLAGKSIEQTKIRSRTGCTIVGIEHGEEFIPNPDPSTILHEGSTLTLIGTLDQIQKFKCSL